MEQKSKSARYLRNDMFLIGFLLLVALVVGIYLFFLRESGDFVKVTVNGEPYAIYSLSEDRTEDIYTGEEGNQLNRLIISGGKAFVETATCPDGICSAHKAIFRNGESIVCLPHCVVITVYSERPSGEPDVVL